MIKKVKVMASSLVLSGLVVANKVLAANCTQPTGCGTVTNPCVNPQPCTIVTNSAGAGSVDVGQLNTGIGLESYISSIVSFAIWAAGLLSVAFIIIGGFQYITAGTSKDGVTKAKNTLLYAIIGLVIVLLAIVIRNFVLTRLAVTVPTL